MPERKSYICDDCKLGERNEKKSKGNIDTNTDNSNMEAQLLELASITRTTTATEAIANSNKIHLINIAADYFRWYLNCCYWVVKRVRKRANVRPGP